jgi:hypothetical protein
MGNTTIGNLPPRYSFVLNPHANVRLTKCPNCRKATHLRKFALFIHVGEWGAMALGKTCRYCSQCEVMMVQQAELEEELAHGLSRVAPQVQAKDYLVLGTIEKKAWRKGLKAKAKPLAAMLDHVAQFKHHYKLEPGQ